MASHTQASLVIEWSPSRVRVYDPATSRSTIAPSLGEVRDVSLAGRDAVIAVSRTSVFIRSMYLPNASKAEIRRILEMQVLRDLPFAPGEFVFDFRLGDTPSARGKVAVLGALKIELLNRIYEETKAAGLRVKAVLPAALGAWQAARSNSMRDGAVVDAFESTLSVDIIKDGELWYSRSLPAPLDAEDLSDEVERSFRIADVPSGPLLGMSASSLALDIKLTKEPLSFLADVGLIERHLFSFDLPARVEARRLRTERWQATRAIAAALIAISFVGFLAYRRYEAESIISREMAGVNGKHQTATKKLAIVQAKESKFAASNRVLDIAFKPGQRLSDILAVVANTAPAQCWLTSVSLGRGKAMNLIGLATSDSEVSSFVTELTKSPRFRDVKVISMNRAVIGKKPVTEFSIVGFANGNLGIERTKSPMRTVGAKP